VVEGSGPGGIDVWMGDFTFEELEVVTNEQDISTPKYLHLLR